MQDNPMYIPKIQSPKQHMIIRLDTFFSEHTININHTDRIVKIKIIISITAIIIYSFSSSERSSEKL